MASSLSLTHLAGMCQLGCMRPKSILMLSLVGIPLNAWATSLAADLDSSHVIDVEFDSSIVVLVSVIKAEERFLTVLLSI